MRNTLSIAVAAFGLTACALNSESTRMQMVKDRAAFDLSCSNNHVMKISENSYGVVGCEKKATYVLDGCVSGAYQSGCTVSLDVVQDPTNTVRPANLTKPPSQ